VKRAISFLISLTPDLSRESIRADRCGKGSFRMETIKGLIENSEKVLREIIGSFLRRQESPIFKAFLDSRSPIGVGDKLRGSEKKVGFSEISNLLLDRKHFFS